MKRGIEFHSARPCRKGHTLRITTSRGCLICKRVGWRKWYRDNLRTPEARKRRQEAERARRISDPRRLMLSRAKRRAKLFNLPFALVIADIIVPRRCPVLGLTLMVGERRSGACSPSLDRIDPRRGYVRDNIAVISQRANQIKNEATLEDLHAVLRWVERHRA